MSGSTIGSFAGAGIGWLIGGPAGARWGWMIGGAIGGVVAPERVQGPRLTDAQKQTSQEGVPIPFGYGTFTCMGNLIWADVLVEHEHEEGGKGGPTQVTYTYTRSFAIGFCEGEAFIQQVKINGKLVYDISPDSEITSQNARFLETATIYSGSETQTADPTMEAVLGVGNVPGYRGLCYIVWEGYDCTDTQGAVPQVEVVGQKCGTLTESEGGIGGIASFYYPLQSDFADQTGNLNDLTPDGAYSFTGVGFSGRATASQGSGLDGATAYTISATLQIAEETSGIALSTGHFFNTIFGWYQWSIWVQEMTIFAGINNGGGGSTDILEGPLLTPGESATVTIHKTASTFSLYVNGQFIDSMSAGGSFIGTGTMLVEGVTNDTGTWGHIWGISRALTEDELAASAAEVGHNDSLIPVPDAPGTYTDADGNVNATMSASQSLSDCEPTLDEVLLDLCERAGIDAEFVDVDGLDAVPVLGFKCAAPNGSAAEYIEALRLAYFFDRGEWDKQIHFPLRGGDSVATIPAADLVRLDELKPPLQQTKIQEPELLRKVQVLTVDPDAGYSMGKQPWERRAGTIQARGEETIEVPVTATADEAAQIAERRGKSAWAETIKFRYGLTCKWSKLTPTDIVTVTDAQGVTHRMRLQDMNEAAGLISIEEAVRDRQSVWTEMAATGGSNTNNPPPVPGLIGPTVFAAMNLPQLRDQDGSGIYVGAAGILAGWRGCQVLISFDGGVSYTVALTITRPTKVGVLTADFTVSTEPMAVHVYGGALENKTTAQVEAGANRAAVASAGDSAADTVAEVFSYEDATETSSGYWDLETIDPGLMGTTAASHVQGDSFMDLATCYFIPISAERAGTTLYLKAVPLGTSADSITPITLVFEPAEVIIDGGEIA